MAELVANEPPEGGIVLVDPFNRADRWMQSDVTLPIEP
jgi:hypothetical protein